MNGTATGTFAIRMTPAQAFAPALGRMTFDKTWEGDLKGESLGELLSVGDPASGTAAYTVLEVFSGTLAGHRGQVAFHQYGTMQGGQTTLSYRVVPGSGLGELAGLRGELTLTVVDRVHHYALNYVLEAGQAAVTGPTGTLP